MKITQHTKKKTNQLYWIAKDLTLEQNNHLLACGWNPVRFGEGLMTTNKDLADVVERNMGQTSTLSDEDVDQDDYASMTVNDLRPLVRAAGWTGPDVLKASKAALVKFLETGEKPVVEGSVSTEAMGLQFVELLKQISGTAGVDEEAVRLIVAQEMKNAVHRIEVIQANGGVIPVGIQHNKFETLFRIASVKVGEEKKHRPLDVMLVGPAGSGKTTACHAVADALGIQFYAFSVGMQTTKSDLLGYMDAMGHYIASVLFKAYKEGGLFLLDEVDAGNSNVLTILNAMLANGSYIFPNGERVERHEDFVCFAAANTYGLGADRSYIGRNQLDVPPEWA